MHPECTPVVVVTPAPAPKPAGDRYVIRRAVPYGDSEVRHQIVDTLIGWEVAIHNSYGAAHLDAYCRNHPHNPYCRHTRELAS